MWSILMTFKSVSAKILCLPFLLSAQLITWIKLISSTLLHKKKKIENCWLVLCVTDKKYITKTINNALQSLVTCTKSKGVQAWILTYIDTCKLHRINNPRIWSTCILFVYYSKSHWLVWRPRISIWDNMHPCRPIKEQRYGGKN